MKIVKPSRVRRYVARLDARGKHGRPATVSRVRDEPYARVRVAVDRLDAIEPANRERIQAYATRSTPFPPVLAQYGARSCRKNVDELFVWNGNHRVAAARLRGDRTIEVLVPISDYRRWKTRVC